VTEIAVKDTERDKGESITGRVLSGTPTSCVLQRVGKSGGTQTVRAKVGGGGEGDRSPTEELRRHSKAPARNIGGNLENICVVPPLG